MCEVIYEIQKESFKYDIPFERRGGFYHKFPTPISITRNIETIQLGEPDEVTFKSIFKTQNSDRFNDVNIIPDEIIIHRIALDGKNPYKLTITNCKDMLFAVREKMSVRKIIERALVQLLYMLGDYDGNNIPMLLTAPKVHENEFIHISYFAVTDAVTHVDGMNYFECTNGKEVIEFESSVDIPTGNVEAHSATLRAGESKVVYGMGR